VFGVKWILGERPVVCIVVHTTQHYSLRKDTQINVSCV
jgi:hypothetical protein